MEDLLQTKINEARNSLPKETREAVDTIDWKTIILGIRGNYNSEQLETLETETELLLSGLVRPEDYQKELESRMKISHNDVLKLINEIDQMVFRKIQEVLIKKTKEIKPIVFDSRFATLDQNIQEAIAKSNWQKKLYDISIKNKLPVDKMAFLDDVTVKVISGKISPSDYEKELVKNLGQLKTDDIKAIIIGINENIMKVIRKFEQEQTQTKEENIIEIPIPPYKNESTKTKEKSTEKENLSFKNDAEVYASSGIQMVNEDTSIQNEPSQELSLQKGEEEKMTIGEDRILAKSDIDIIEDKPISVQEHLLPNTETQKKELEGIENPVKVATSIIGNKLKNTTISSNKTNDYSLPKITSDDKIPLPDEGYTSKLHDPYHEDII